MTWWMLRNSRGGPDALLTFAAGAVAVSLLRVLVGGFSGAGIVITPADAGVLAALLTPTLGAYVARRLGVKDGNP